MELDETKEKWTKVWKEQQITPFKSLTYESGMVRH